MASMTRPPRGSKAKGGPSKEPSNLRILKGGKQRPGEPVPGEVPVAAPKHLSEAALAEWDRLAPDLERKGLLTGWDVEAFAIYCEAVAGRHVARRLVDEVGMLVAGRGDTLVRNPAFQLWRDHAMITLTAASRFGLSPSDRASLPAKESDDSEALFSK